MINATIYLFISILLEESIDAKFISADENGTDSLRNSASRKFQHTILTGITGYRNKYCTFGFIMPVFRLLLRRWIICANFRTASFAFSKAS